MSGLLAISPHLDDAALGASGLIASLPGSTVATVFAGRPVGTAPLTDWDRACGFESAHDAMSERYREDDAALALLGARPLRLLHLDRHYGVACRKKILGEIVAVMLESQPAVIAFPLGLHHPDHLTVADIVLQLRDIMLDNRVEWIAWADVPYRALPGVVDARLERLRTDRDVRPWTTPVAPFAGKSYALGRYRSQLRALAMDAVLDIGDTVRPEQYWSIGPAVAPMSSRCFII